MNMQNGISCVAPFRQTLNFTPTRRAQEVSENPSADGSNARCRHTTTTLALVCPAHSPTYILDHTRPLRACAKMACSHVQWAEQATRSIAVAPGLAEPRTVSDEALEDDLTCPICLGLLRDATATECQHRFCAGCIHNRLHLAGGCI